MPQRMLAAVALALVLMSAASAQQSVRVRGTIAAVDGRTLTVKSPEGADITFNVTDKVRVFGVVTATLADIKPGAYVGVGAMTQADGSHRAVQFTVFSEELRGSGEGHGAWSRGPQSTMTNATVETTATVSSTEGQVVVLKYKGGEQKIVVPPDATILRYITSDAKRTEARRGHRQHRGAKAGRHLGGRARQCRPRRRDAAVGVDPHGEERRVSDASRTMRIRCGASLISTSLLIGRKAAVSKDEASWRCAFPSVASWFETRSP